ncbi:MAG: hypothetical protein MUO76_14935 [Anaerolineaceae bacterium]|nr:hypothetical protein [Anaerolineaceae bacterium]
MVKKIFLLGTVVMVLILGVASIVYAQDEEPPVPFDSEGEGPFGRYDRGRFRQQSPIWDEMFELLADRLDVTVDDLSERLQNGETLLDIALEQGISEEDFKGMMDEIRDEAIDKALAEELITEEQAELMRADGGVRQFFRPSQGERDLVFMPQVHAMLAEDLGLTVEELQDAIVNGGTLLDIALAQGMSEEDFAAMRTEVYEEVLDNAVAEGTITEEQAAQIRERLEAGSPFSGQRGAWHQFSSHPQILESLAEELGLDIEEMRGRIQVGEKVQDLLDEYGLNLEDLRGIMKDLRAQGFHKFQDAIDAGKFTPEQIEQFRDHAGERPFKRLFPGFQSLWNNQQ